MSRSVPPFRPLPDPSAALRRYTQLGTTRHGHNPLKREAPDSFFSLLQENVLDQHRWATRSELRYAIVTWIEHTYNHRRRQRALGKLTPVEFELAFTQPAAHAA